MITKIYANITVNYHCSEDDIKATNLIYALKFPNGKYYIGQTNTKFGLKNRIQSHCYESKSIVKNRNAYKDNIIKKYKKFDVFILKKCTLENIDFFEIFYINILKNKIVNLESGGCKNKTASEETKTKIKNKVREYNIKNPKNIKINVYDLKGNFIRSHNTIAEVKEYYNVNNITIYNALYQNKRRFLGKYQIFREGYNKPIDYTNVKRAYKKKIKDENELFFKYSPSTGEFIEEIKSINLSVKDRFYIKKSIKNNILYNGYAWSNVKKNKIDVPKSHYEKVSDKLSRPILQLDENLNIVKKWKNAKKAGEFYGGRSEELIREVCKRWRRHTKGFIWCYEDEYEWYKSMWGEKLVRKR